jgi:hypothetical protein
MQRARHPDVRPNGRSPVVKWALIRANPSELVVLSPDVTWPTVEIPVDQAKYILSRDLTRVIAILF